MSGTWFTNLEDIVYSAVEYIPLVGTVYSFKRAAIAHAHHDDKRFWLSAANFAESAVRDVVLLSATVEATPVVIIHTMVESLTDKLIDIYTAPSPTRIPINATIDKSKSHVLVAGSTREQADKVAADLFQGKAKGIHHFHRSVFTGTLVEPNYAPKGEKIWLRLPEGFYQGAQVTFMWRWTVDAAGVKNGPVSTHGRLNMTSGTPTKFGLLAGRKGYYDFWGSVVGKDTLDVTTNIAGKDVAIRFTRQPPPPAP